MKKNDDQTPTPPEPASAAPPTSGAAPACEPELELQPEPDPTTTRIAQLEAERDEFLDHYRRIAAEFDNYKKRVARDRHELTQRASERLLRDLLTVLDDLERAVAAFNDHDPEQVAAGVTLVHRALKTLVAKEGIVELDPLGEPFDPHRHEALLQQPADAPEGRVIEVLQKGFALGDRVIRPARVVVAAPKQA